MKVDFIASLKQALNGKLNALSGAKNGINCTVVEPCNYCLLIYKKFMKG